MRAKNNTAIDGFAARAQDFASEEYASAVAKPTLTAVDAMPFGYRALVNEYGYIDVYRAWTRGWSVERIRAAAKDGFFKL